VFSGTRDDDDDDDDNDVVVVVHLGCRVSTTQPANVQRHTATQSVSLSLSLSLSLRVCHCVRVSLCPSVSFYVCPACFVRLLHYKQRESQSGR